MLLRFSPCVVIAAAFLAFPYAVLAGGDAETPVVYQVSAEMAAFSSANRAAFVASYIDTPTILDDVAPFVWSNAGRWYDTVRPLFADVAMTPGSPLEVLVKGNRAFVAIPFTINGHGSKGKAFRASGYWTGALVQVEGGWRIANAAITISK